MDDPFILLKNSYFSYICILTELFINIYILNKNMLLDLKLVFVDVLLFFYKIFEFYIVNFKCSCKDLINFS